MFDFPVDKNDVSIFSASLVLPLQIPYTNYFPPASLQQKQSGLQGNYRATKRSHVMGRVSSDGGILEEVIDIQSTVLGGGQFRDKEIPRSLGVEAVDIL